MSETTLRIYHLDTGLSGGDMTLVAQWGADGKPSWLCLIDGGSLADKTVLDRAWNTFGFGSKKLDYVICTNYNPNYTEGLASILWDSNYFDANVLNPGTNTKIVDRGQQGQVMEDATKGGSVFVSYPLETTSFYQYRRNIQEVLYTDALLGKWWTQKVAVWQSGEGVTGWTAPEEYINKSGGAMGTDDVKIQIITMDGYVGKGYAAAIPKGKEHQELNYSLGLLISYNDFHYYHGGVLASCVEGGTSRYEAIPEANKNSILEVNKLKNVSVAKLSNQGADTGSSKEFLEQLAPAAAIITCGTDRAKADAEHSSLEEISFPGQGVLNDIPDTTRCYLNGETPSANLELVPGKHVITGAWAQGDKLPLGFADIVVEVTGKGSMGNGKGQPSKFTVAYEAPVDVFTGKSGAFTYDQVQSIREQFSYT